MTIYNVQVGMQTFRVDISGNQLTIDGILQQARLIRLNANNLFLLCWEHKNRVLHLQPQGEQTYAVTTEGRRVIAQVDAPQAGKTAHRAAEAALANQLVAPMPGLIAKVHVQVGDGVEKGQVLVTEESMKMQMELRAPVTGTVSRVDARPQSQVEKGSLLVEITPDAG